MDLFQSLIFGGLLPATAAAIALIGALWLRWPLAVAVAPLIALCTGWILLFSIPALPASNSYDWIFWGTLVGGGWSALMTSRVAPKGQWILLILFLILFTFCGLTLWPLVPHSFSAKEWFPQVMAAAIFFSLLASLALRLERRLGSVPLLLTAVTQVLLLSFISLLGGSARLAQTTGAFQAGLGALLLLALIRPGSVLGNAWVATWTLFWATLTLNLYHYMEVPWPALLLPAAPILFGAYFPMIGSLKSLGARSALMVVITVILCGLSFLWLSLELPL